MMQQRLNRNMQGGRIFNGNCFGTLCESFSKFVVYLRTMKVQLREAGDAPRLHQVTKTLPNISKYSYKTIVL